MAHEFSILGMWSPHGTGLNQKVVGYPPNFHFTIVPVELVSSVAFRVHSPLYNNIGDFSLLAACIVPSATMKASY